MQHSWRGVTNVEQPTIEVEVNAQNVDLLAFLDELEDDFGSVEMREYEVEVEGAMVFVSLSPKFCVSY